MRNIILITAVFIISQAFIPASSQEEISWSEGTKSTGSASFNRIIPMSGDSVLVHQSDPLSNNDLISLFHEGKLIWQKERNTGTEPQIHFGLSKYGLIGSTYSKEHYSLVKYNQETNEFTKPIPAFTFPAWAQQLSDKERSAVIMEMVAEYRPQHSRIFGLTMMETVDGAIEINTRVYNYDLKQIAINKHKLSLDEIDLEVVHRTMDDQGNFYLLFKAKPEGLGICEHCYIIFKLGKEGVISSEVIKMPRGITLDPQIQINEAQDQILFTANLLSSDGEPFGQAFKSFKIKDLVVHLDMRVTNLSKRYEVEKPSAAFKPGSTLDSDWKLNYLGRAGSRADEFLFAASYTGKVKDDVDATGSIMIFKYNNEFEYQWMKRTTNTDRRMENSSINASTVLYGDGFVVIPGKEEANGSHSGDVLTIINESGQISEIRIPGVNGKPAHVLEVKTHGTQIYVLAECDGKLHYTAINKP